MEEKPVETLHCVRLQDQLGGQWTQNGRGSLDVSPFVGTWLNTNKTSPEIVKIIVAAQDGVLTMRILTAGDPEPFDWGEVTADIVYADSNSSDEPAAFSAHYSLDFMESQFGVILNQGLLVVAFYNTFRNDGARSNYFNREFFYR
jgi:hypothetical protein